MAGTSPIIKRIQAFKFELIDFYDLFSHVPILGKGGKGIIEGVNQLENTVTYRSLNNPKNVLTADVRSVKLMLRRMSYFKSKDIRIVSNLALDTEGFDATITREGRKIIASDEVGRRVVIDLTDDNMAISVAIHGKPVETKNLPFIFAYMIKKGFDMFGLTNRAFAISVSSIEVKGF